MGHQFLTRWPAIWRCDVTVDFSIDCTGCEKCILRGGKTQQQQTERLTRSTTTLRKPFPYIRIQPTIAQQFNTIQAKDMSSLCDDFDDSDDMEVS